jgi:hypothetical protein
VTTRRASICAAVVAVATVLAGGVAAAQSDDQRVGAVPDLVLTVAESALPGQPIRFEAVLRDADGVAVEGATIEFVTEVAWGNRLRGDVVLATAQTDGSGLARADAELRAAGEARVFARFDGDERLAPQSAEAVVTVAVDGQVYLPSVGIDVPYLTVWWLLVIVGLVWLLYVLVAGRIFAIARAGDAGEDSYVGADRRRFLGRFLVPIGLGAVVASLGSGLVALIARSPRTHANLGSVADHVAAGHRVTPIARLGQPVAPRPMPPLLEAEVSFANDVLPILRAKGGPHAHPPKHSPTPRGIRLDSYDHLMASSWLVVPGRPADSRLVNVLLDPAAQMPPSVPPLPDEEIQVIASWIAQGALDN